MKTPYALAWTHWITGREGQTCLDPGILKSSPHYVTLLENRLKYAFDAGWNARGESTMERAERAAASAGAPHEP